MELPATDHAFLDASGYEYHVVEDQQMLCVRIRNYALPPGLSHETVEVMFRLQAGYPDLPPDMWWMYPAITTAAGTAIAATESMELHFGLSWQRWSRHLPPNTWAPGIDSLKSFMALLDNETRRASSVVLA